MSQHGYTILETMVAMAILLTVIAVAIALVDPSQASFAAQIEAADMQQRLRVAAGALSRDVLMAANWARGMLIANW